MYNIQTFSWEDLAGRTVKIQSRTYEKGVVVVARDIFTNELFIVKDETGLKEK